VKTISTPISAALAVVLASAGLLVTPAKGSAPSDLLPPSRRRATVEMAMRLTKPLDLDPLPSDLIQPFTPPGFDQEDKEEQEAVLKEQLKRGGPARKNPEVAAPLSDSEILRQISAKIAPSGTIMVNGNQMLIFGKNFVKIGAHFTVTYRGADYNLVLIEVEHNSFTLRLNREEITRSLQPGKFQ
jgi:hypothetical protein